MAGLVCDHEIDLGLQPNGLGRAAAPPKDRDLARPDFNPARPEAEVIQVNTDVGRVSDVNGRTVGRWKA